MDDYVSITLKYAASQVVGYHPGQELGFHDLTELRFVPVLLEDGPGLAPSLKAVKVTRQMQRLLTLRAA